MKECEFFIDNKTVPSRRKKDSEKSVPFLDNIFSSQNSSSDLLEQTMFYEKRIYDLQQLIEVAKSFSSTLDFKNLLESISYVCMAQMHVLGAEIFTKDFIENEKFILSTEDIANPFESKLKKTIPYNSPITEKLLELNGPVELEQLIHLIKKDSFEKYESCKKIFDVFKELSPSLIVPMIQKTHLNGILILQERIVIEGEVNYNQYEKEMIMSIASLAAVAINNTSLIEIASTDLMTKLKQKFSFFNSLSDIMDSKDAYRRRLAVIMFDIDFFKNFNDTYGHECGDYVLISVAKLIRDNLRDSDIACRYGGEEFTVLLENTSKEEAMIVAERIRTKIDENIFIYDGKALHVTISGGVSMYTRRNIGITPAQLVNQADMALYKSKNTGRNKVTYFRHLAKKKTE